jgi:hypothetical protein
LCSDYLHRQDNDIGAGGGYLYRSMILVKVQAGKVQTGCRQARCRQGAGRQYLCKSQY